MPKNAMSQKTQTPLSETSQATNLSQVSIQTVRAEMARMSQSKALEVHAEDVEMRQSAALEVQTSALSARQSAIGLLQTKDATVYQSNLAMTRAEQANLQGNIGVAVANSLCLENAYSGLVAANEIRGEKIEAVVLLSRKVEGNVSVVLDTRGALIAGLLGGLFAGMILLVGRMVLGKK